MSRSCIIPLVAFAIILVVIGIHALYIVSTDNDTDQTDTTTDRPTDENTPSVNKPPKVSIPTTTTTVLTTVPPVSNVSMLKVMVDYENEGQTALLSWNESTNKYVVSVYPLTALVKIEESNSQGAIITGLDSWTAYELDVIDELESTVLSKIQIPRKATVISYEDSQSTFEFYQGEHIDDVINLVGLTSSDVSFKIEPSLPAGLHFGHRNGGIFGTPEVSIANSTYTVSAYNGRGLVSTHIAIIVFPAELPIFQHESTSGNGKNLVKFRFESEKEITPIEFGANDETNYLERIITWNVSPIPAELNGLVFDNQAGMLSGFSDVVTQWKFQVFAVNSVGESSLDVVVEFYKQVVPSSSKITYNQGNLVEGISVLPKLVNTDGDEYEWNFSNDTPAPKGIVLDKSSGAISGTALEAGSDSYIIEATNSDGSLLAVSEITIDILESGEQKWRQFNCGGSDSTPQSSYGLWSNNESEFLKGNGDTKYYDKLSIISQATRVGVLDPPLEVTLTETYAPMLEYELPIESSGLWRVNIYFAEIAASVKLGDRVVDIYLNDELVESGFDILSKVGYYTSIAVEYDVEVESGPISLVLIASKNNAKVSAIAYGPVERQAEIHIQPANHVLDFGEIQLGEDLSASRSFSFTSFGIPGTSTLLGKIQQGSMSCQRGCDNPRAWAVTGKESTPIISKPNQHEVIGMLDLVIPEFSLFNTKNTFTVTWDGEVAQNPGPVEVLINFEGVNMEMISLIAVANLLPLTTTTITTKPTINPGGGGENTSGGDIQEVTYGTPSSSISFTVNKVLDIEKPTSTLYSPSDNRIYISSISGIIESYEVDESYQLSSKVTIDTIAKNHAQDGSYQILGMAMNPFDGDTLKLYVSWNKLFSGGGSCVDDDTEYGYPGGVSMLVKEGAEWKEHILAENLPVSNYDHAINGIVFDQNGDLLVNSGSNTNGGAEGKCRLGAVADSPFTAAILRIPISKGTHKRTVEYLDSNGKVDMDGLNGLDVTGSTATDIEVFSPGHRNSYRCVFTTQGHMYCTDNGPNNGYGEASKSLIETIGDVTFTKDELNKVYAYEQHKTYYGSANRNRGKMTGDDIQYKWIGGNTASYETYKEPVATMKSSMNGIVEYTSMAFNGGMRGELIIQKYKSSPFRFKLSDNGEKAKDLGVVSSETQLFKGLDLAIAPGGVLLSSGYINDNFHVGIPEENTKGLIVYDITPWRSPAAGQNTFVIAGQSFGDSAQVFIGGIEATVTKVTTQRIFGIFPAGNASDMLLDVEVISWTGKQGEKMKLEKAFRYLSLPGSEPILKV